MTMKQYVMATVATDWLVLLSIAVTAQPPTAISGRPSPLNSPMAKEVSVLPRLTPTGGWNVASPLPTSTPRPVPKALTVPTIRSWFPSLLKSPIAIEPINPPASSKCNGMPNVPLPLPSRIEKPPPSLNGTIIGGSEILDMIVIEIAHGERINRSGRH